MNTVTIRRILSLLGLMAVMLCAMAVSADPLPAPSAPQDEGRFPAVPTLSQPANGGKIEQNGIFSWTNLNATLSKLKIRVVETGEIIVIKVTQTDCNGSYCWWYPTKADLFDKVQDGWSITWKVVSKFAGNPIRTKTAAFSATVNEVDVPNLISPVDNVLLLPAHSLKWKNDSQQNPYYTLTITNTATGEKISTTLEAYSACQAECAVNPHSLPGDLTSATTYTWFVKAKGYTGETAKSEVRTFVTP